MRYTLTLRNLTDLPLTAPRDPVRAPGAVRLPGGQCRARRPRDSGPDRRSFPRVPARHPGGIRRSERGREAGPGEHGYAALSFTLAPGAERPPRLLRQLGGGGGHGPRATRCQVSNACGGNGRWSKRTRCTAACHGARGACSTIATATAAMGASSPVSAGAVVALDDGSSVTTDSEGASTCRSRFGPAGAQDRPGPPRHAGRCRPPTPRAVVDVSPGLVATVRFGVSVRLGHAEHGAPAGQGAGDHHRSDGAGRPRGRQRRPRLGAGATGRPVPVRTVDAPGSTAESSGRILKLVGDRIDSTTAFAHHAGAMSDALRWWLEIQNSRHQIVQSLEGDGVPPQRVSWDGGLREDYRASRWGHLLLSAPRPVRRQHGGGRAAPLDRSGARLADRALHAARRRLPARGAPPSRSRPASRSPGWRAPSRRHPARWWSSRAIPTRSDRPKPNRQLSQRRADAVASYLVERGGVARGRLVVEGHGETRPVAGNETEDGRELNNRIEIYGMTAEVKRSRSLRRVPRGRHRACRCASRCRSTASGGFACRVPTGDNDTPRGRAHQPAWGGPPWPGCACRSSRSARRTASC